MSSKRGDVLGFDVQSNMQCRQNGAMCWALTYRVICNVVITGASVLGFDTGVDL